MDKATMQTGRQQQRQPHGHAHQRGISLMPAIAAVFLVTIIALQIDMPRKQQQLQRMQSTADTNTSVQLLSATLSYFNEYNEWPDNTSQLKRYLPILPSDTDLGNMAKLITNDVTGDKTILLFNAKSYTQAKRLAWQFNKLDMDIVNKSGDVSDDQSQNTWVKIQLDRKKYGAWADYSAWSPAECTYETGQQTRTAQDCKKNANDYSWCLGSKVETKYCELPAEWLVDDDVGAEFKYSACSNNRQTKTPTICKQGWKEGKRVDCNINSHAARTIACQPASWQRTWGEWEDTAAPPEKTLSPWQPIWWFSWEDNEPVAERVYQKSNLIKQTCIKGTVNETDHYACDISLKLDPDVYQRRSKKKNPGVFDSGWQCDGIYLRWTREDDPDTDCN